jgi:mannan endo-1,4-beta-mannosidase
LVQELWIGVDGREERLRLLELDQAPALAGSGYGMLRIGVAEAAPYFVDEAGADWTPIGQNDALTWPELHGLIGRRDLASVERHLRGLKASGVTMLRLMLEYCQSENAFLERTAGTFDPVLVQAWDDLVALCRHVGLRLLLTPFDTFFTWLNWDRHPYNRANGGPCDSRERLLTCETTRAFIKRRLEFATKRWGGDGTIFAWDIWNELHPVQGENRPTCFQDFIGDIAPWLKGQERRLFGRARPLTASVFGPELEWKPWLKEAIFRHRELDFASSHSYEEGTIDYPTDTVTAAVSIGRLVREALAEIRDGRPFLDSEHGPIHTFKDHGLTLPEPFDDEYFAHIQWAHLASGGVGGGMRWPNHHPHALTPGMRRAQGSLARFLPLLDWQRFPRRPLHGELRSEGTDGVHLFASGSDRQAVLYLLRGDTIGPDGMLDRAAAPIAPGLLLPDMAPGGYCVTAWDPAGARAVASAAHLHPGGPLRVEASSFRTDLALAVRRIGAHEA